MSVVSLFDQDPASQRLFADHIRQRREDCDRVLNALGLDAVLIHSGRPTLRAFDDTAPPFRAHGHFAAWVPSPFTPDCLLVLRPGRTPQLWFCQPSDFWHQAPEPPAAWWADSFDLQVIDSPQAWEDCFSVQRAGAVIGEAGHLAHLGSGLDLNPPVLLQQLDQMRTAKTPWEQACLAAANRTAATAHQAAAQAFFAGSSELDIHLAYLGAARLADEELAYHSIVALNEHAAVLHYQYRERQPPEVLRSFLLDAGAGHLGYASDITRTWAYSDQTEFAALIEAMDRLQQELCSAVRVGASFVDLHLQTHRGVAAILHQAGLVKVAVDEQLDAGLTRAFFPHGLGHYLGVQVHDVAGQVAADGSALPPPPEHPFLRLTRRLAEHEVVTIEPGLYFIPMLLEPLRHGPYSDQINWTAIDHLMPCGGIRIEDNVVVTAGEPVNLTRRAFAGVA